MRNFIFDYYGEPCITTFGTGYYKKCIFIKDIPDDLAPQLLPDITNPINVEDAEAHKDAWLDIQVKGTVVIDGERYSLDSSNKNEPLVKDGTKPVVAAEPPVSDGVKEVVELPKEEGESSTVAEVHITGTGGVHATMEAITEQATSTEVDKIGEPPTNPEDTTKIIEGMAEAFKGHENDEPCVLPEVNTIPNSVFDLIEEWTNSAPDQAALKEDGDAYCIENDWHYSEGYYFVDNVREMVRYIHSDAYGVDLTMSIREVQVVRAHGNKHQ